VQQILVDALPPSPSGTTLALKWSLLKFSLFRLKLIVTFLFFWRYGRVCVPPCGVQVPMVVRSMPEERPSVRGGQASAAQTASVEKLSASAFQKSLHGIDYPAGKQDLINHARKNKAPDSVIEVLEMFEEKTFQSAADVSQEFGRVK